MDDYILLKLYSYYILIKFFWDGKCFHSCDDYIIYLIVEQLWKYFSANCKNKCRLTYVSFQKPIQFLKYTLLKDTMKAFDDFKNKQESV